MHLICGIQGRLSSILLFLTLLISRIFVQVLPRFVYENVRIVAKKGIVHIVFIKNEFIVNGRYKNRKLERNKKFANIHFYLCGTKQV